MTRRTPKSVFIFYGIFISLLLVIIGFALMYRSGYRLNGFNFVKAGSLEISVDLEGSQIAIDNSLRKTTSAPNEKLSFSNLTPGIHTILVAKANYWPWSKYISIPEDGLISIAPFSVPANTNGLLIPEGDAEYKTINLLIGQNSLPTKESKKISSSGKTALWVQDSTFIAEWISEEPVPHYFCGEASCSNKTFEITKIKASIGNADFFKEREDIIIFSSGKGVYALEMDKRGTQNFYPIYEGANPSYAKNTPTTLYIKDGASLMEVGL